MQREPLISRTRYQIVHGQVQERCRREIAGVLPSRNDSPTMADRARLPYTCATITEIQRLANIVPINLMRRTTRPVTVGSHIIPTDTAVLPQISAVLTDKRMFDQPCEFRPERFLASPSTKDRDHQYNSEQSETVRVAAVSDSRRYSVNRVQVVAFSLGKRQCLGESLARMELFLVFVSLLHHFTFAIPPGKAPPSLEPVLGATLMPRPCQLLVTSNFAAPK